MSESLKVLMVVPSYKPAFVYGGPIQAIATLCEAMVEAGHSVTVFTTTANGDLELDVEKGKEYIIDGVRVKYFRRITRGHSNFSPQLLKVLYKQVNGFDIVHIHSWWNLVVIPATWICLLKGITPVISPRGTLTEYTFTHKKNRIKRLFHALSGRKLLNQATLLFTSQREKDVALQYVKGKTNYIVPNLLVFPDQELNGHRDTEHLKLIFLGRIDPAKNLEFLIQVLKKPKKFQYRLIIAGEGLPSYVEQLKKRAISMSEIQWIGPVEGVEKFRQLAEADILVLPSHTENYGNVVFEALSQGTPVLISSNVGAKDYIIDHNLGWVVEAEEQAWEEVLNIIATDKASRDRIRQRAPGCISRDFNRRDQVRVYAAIYMEHMKGTAQ